MPRSASGVPGSASGRWDDRESLDLARTVIRRTSADEVRAACGLTGARAIYDSDEWRAARAELEADDWPVLVSSRLDVHRAVRSSLSRSGLYYYLRALDLPSIEETRLRETQLLAERRRRIATFRDRECAWRVATELAERGCLQRDTLDRFRWEVRLAAALLVSDDSALREAQRILEVLQRPPPSRRHRNDELHRGRVAFARNVGLRLREEDGAQYWTWERVASLALGSDGDWATPPCPGFVAAWADRDLAEQLRQDKSRVTRLERELVP